MNTPHDKLLDDAELDAYLKRDSAYSQRYQAMDADEVPAELDQLILNKAALTPSQSNVTALRLRRLKRFSVPFALAATLVLSVSIVIQMPKEVLVTNKVSDTVTESKSIKPDTPTAPLPAAPAPNTLNVEMEAPAPASIHQPKLDTPPPPKQEPSRREETRAQALAEPASPSPTVVANSTAISPIGRLSSPATKPAEPSAATPLAASKEYKSEGDAVAVQDAVKAQDQSELSEMIVTGSRRTRQSSQNSNSPVTSVNADNASTERAGPRNTVPLAKRATDSDARTAKERESQPELWLAYIRELRSANKKDDADKEWNRFVKAYPNYEVAADDVARGSK
jgi:hypothetical protein